MSFANQTDSSHGGPERGSPAAQSNGLAVLDRAIGAVCRLVLYITMGVVFLILSINVGLRYVAGTSLSWASELPELLFPWMIMAGVILAAQHGSHIAVVLVTQKLSNKLRSWVLAFGSLVVIALYGYMAFIAWPLMEIAHDERTPVLQVPGSVTVWALMAGFTLLTLVTLIRLPRVLNTETHASSEHAGDHS